MSHGFTVMPGASLQPYTPARHTDTVNHRLLDGDTAQGRMSIVHGVIGPEGEALEHYHAHSAQFIHILGGECDVRNDDGSVRLGAGDSVYIPTGVRHRVTPLPGKELELINVYQPALRSDDILH